jgi:hypothetical protein
VVWGTPASKREAQTAHLTLPHPKRSIVTGQLRDNEDVTNEASEVELSARDLRVVARYAA